MTTSDLYAQAMAECAAREAAFADIPLPIGAVECSGYSSIDPLVRVSVLTNYDPPNRLLHLGQRVPKHGRNRNRRGGVRHGKWTTPFR